MEMRPGRQPLTPLSGGLAARQSGRFERLLGNRRIWKSAIYSMALVTYLCSFLFFGLTIADVREAGASNLAIIHLLVALYFLIQVIFLFVLSETVERRRQSQPIDFPDRRTKIS